MDVQDWTVEANAIVQEVRPFVKVAALSDVLNSQERRRCGISDSVQRVFINLETKEEKKYTIQLGRFGFKIVGNRFDHLDPELEKGTENFETPYALLQTLSPMYTQSFGQELISKLGQLSRERE